ncbi:unnamed protein product, partial [Vitis vinifera]
MYKTKEILNQSSQTTKKILKKIMQDKILRHAKTYKEKSNSRITRKQNSIYS